MKYTTSRNFDRLFFQKNFTKFFWQILLLLMLVIPKSYAADSIRSKSIYQTKPWWLFGGISAGLSSMSSDLNNLGEIDKDGFHISPKVSVNYYNSDFVFESGLGWFYNKMSGDRGQFEVTTESKSFYLDFSPRLQLGDHFQIGPLFEFMFGSDVSFSQNLPNFKEENSALFWGLSAKYEFNAKQPIYRIGLDYKRDLTIDDRSVSIVALNFQVGFDVFGSKRKKRYNRSKVANVSGKNRVNVVLGEAEGIFFDFNSYRLDKKSKNYLLKLGVLLKMNQDLC